ncbi:DUF3368 domain-containing protein [Halobacteria archaeon AArc-m2/3/4]|uniref:DUF3368 domain-containing protein n=1 Tax=Natronoglomus mannanivorans TaxID=2979990 RepID=A0ABT2QCF7_9EURY|nr:DUF3368 domain-containing protein [Halobacteria archaeon AArc-m2/3/4]
MPSSEVVVSNTSPLLNLALADRLDVLPEQFESIVVPDAVQTELLAGEDGVGRLETLLESDFVSVQPAENRELVRELRSELDAGEAAAIALALERDADLVLINERDGRTVARRHDLTITGVVGILLRAARDETVDIETAMSELRDAGFWIGDDLYRRAIESVAESTPESESESNSEKS